MCAVLMPPDVNPFAVDKHIISYVGDEVALEQAFLWVLWSFTVSAIPPDLYGAPITDTI